MQIEFLSLLIFSVFAIAVLYSSVGHAGASGYIAVMSLLSLATTEIKPTALTLNILVGSIAAWQFYKAGHFSWALFWPFALLAVPFAFIGGVINLPAHLFKTILGAVLLYSAFRFFVQSKQSSHAHTPPKWAALTSGAVIGLLSGLTGTGGAIFLTPLMLINGWAEPKRAAAVSALFVLLNSAAGLAGFMTNQSALPSYIAPLLLAAALGGTIGAYIGSRRVQSATIKKLLAIVLLIAGLKLIFT
ncbi:MAG TPA: sulfite exporter TauE/SafE family protein [Burkholderiaceae bacterium]|nr:sulfite exporter TauE/SafE family protein [Burkholderiaceae bacterium]